MATELLSKLCFRDKFEHEMEFSIQHLSMMPPVINVPLLDYQHFSNLVGNLTDLIVEVQNFQPSIDAIWNNHQVDDYTEDDYARKNILKHWTHVRSDSNVKAVFSLVHGEFKFSYAYQGLAVTITVE